MKRLAAMWLAAMAIIAAADVPAHSQSALTGTWRFDVGGSRLRLTFRPDFSYHVDWNDDGQTDIHGIYEFWEDRLIMRDEYPDDATDCIAPGVYFYKVEGDRLVFRLYSDDCLPRQGALGQEFIRHR